MAAQCGSNLARVADVSSDDGQSWITSHRIQILNISRIGKGIKYCDTLYVDAPSTIKKTSYIVRADESGTARHKQFHQFKLSQIPY
jgi:hypothetical protein